MARHFQKAVVIEISGSAAARQALARRVRGLVSGAGAGVHAKAQTAAITSTAAPSSSAPHIERDGRVLDAGGAGKSTSAASDSPQLQRPPVCTAQALMWMPSSIRHLCSLAGYCWKGLCAVDVVVGKLKTETCGKGDKTFRCVWRKGLTPLVVVNVPLCAAKAYGKCLLGDTQLFTDELEVMHARLLVALVVMSIVALVACTALVN